MWYSSSVVQLLEEVIIPRTRNTKFHGGREMLNRAGYHSTASIVAEVESTEDWELGKDHDGEPLRWNPSPRTTLAVSDCSRSVSMDFDFGNAEDHRNNLHKVDTMIKLLQEFRAGLALEQRLYTARKRYCQDD